MGETMRQVITHEVGHAIGLPHNMIASASFPVDSLRKASFTSRYGVSATIMDYARQNYVAQPGDNLAPRDFIRRLGPFDDFVINWGYRAIPQARTAQDERTILNGWYTNQNGPMPYRYLPQFAVGIDPRAQTEDLSDDAVRASGYAVENLKKVVPNLVEWTTRSGEDYSELNELYGELLGMWGQYMGHVTNWIGGLRIEFKTADQNGAVYEVVPRARQKAALDFLAANVFRTPSWLLQPNVLARVGPPMGANSLVNRQANVVTQLLDARRLARLGESEAMDAANAYALPTYLDDLRRAMFTGVPDANRRTPSACTSSGSTRSYHRQRQPRRAGPVVVDRVGERSNCRHCWPRLTRDAVTLPRWHGPSCAPSRPMHGVQRPPQRA
jgi:hypothetical protein